MKFLPKLVLGRGTAEGGGGVTGAAPATPPPCFAWLPSPPLRGREEPGLEAA